MPYNYTEYTQADGFVEGVIALNNLSGGLIIDGLLILIFVIILISNSYKPFKDSLFIATIWTSLLCFLLFLGGLASDDAMIFTAIMAIGAGLYHYFSES